jgi:hypothetical protein
MFLRKHNHFRDFQSSGGHATACLKSLTSFDIFFQILVKRLVRPAEGEGRALPIEDLRVDRSIPSACQGRCKTFQKIKFTDNKCGLGELGQGGACQ